MEMAMLMKLWNYWELQVLVLLSFMLQVFLFFSCSLRRRSTNAALKFLIWSAYLLADFVAVYALGQLSRQNADANGVEASHQLVFFWIPFLLIHLGGQDTITAFSAEDNELWLRHLLNLLVQVGLALYVFWKSAARNQLLVSAVFAFVAGIIKYGERTWALKSASQKALRSSISGVVQFPEVANGEEYRYMKMVNFALSSSPGITNLFVGRKIEQMEASAKAVFDGGFYNQISENGELTFKVLDIELANMYDNLYTKARVTRTCAGAILRILTLVSLLAAFVFFLTENKQWHQNRLDMVVTYTLFTGAFCLDICAIFFMVMASPWTWAYFRYRKWHRLACYSWYVFKNVQPESRPLWSNSMGQYNFINSCFSDNMIGKMMKLVGVKEMWTNFRHAKRTDVKTVMKKLLFGRNDFVHFAGTVRPSSGVVLTSPVGSLLDQLLFTPFEVVILALHIYTDIFLLRYGTASCGSTEEGKNLMHTCRTLSEYMCYLLVVHPEMLPVSGGAHDVLEKTSDFVAKSRGTTASKDELLHKLTSDHSILHMLDNPFTTVQNPITLAGLGFGRLKEEAVYSHESLQDLVKAWHGVVVYAAAKSRGSEHAKKLSMGGELLTFLWLHLAHHSLGDLGILQPKLVQLHEPMEFSIFRIFQREYERHPR